MQTSNTSAPFDFGQFMNDLRNSPVEPPVPFVMGEDPLAASVTVFDGWCAGSGDRWTDLRGVTPTAESRVDAAKIREYYANKYVVQVLKGKPLTEYQQNVYEFVTNGTIMEKDIGIIYKLPYLYDEDVHHDDILSEVNHVKPTDFINRVDHVEGLELTPHSSPVYICRRVMSIYQFWFVDKDNNPYILPVQESNQLKTLVNSIHGAGKTITVNSGISKKRLRGHEDYVVNYLVGVELV